MVSEHRAVEQDDGFGAWIRRVAEVVNVAIWAEAAEDGGAGWGVHGLALSPDGDFRRVALDLGQTDAAKLPTDQRIERFATGNDPGLAMLTFQYGRYLLIASSRAGGQPANLQGLWNDLLKPPWDSKWTVNINTEMNYWPAEPANISECTGPLFDILDDCVISGRKTAQAQYGARGWVLHHNTDLWRGTAPINASNHGIWVSGGSWLCHHF